MASTSKVFSNSFFYSFSAVLAKCLGLILLPVYTAFLSPADYGIINLLLSFVSMLTYFVLLALDSALMRFYVDYQDSPETLRRLYGSLILVVTSCFALLSLSLFLSRRFWLDALFSGIPFFPYVLIAILILGEGSIFTLHRRCLETTQQGKKLMTISMMGTFLTAGVAVTLLVFFRMGAKGMLLATLSTDAFFLCFMIVDVVRHKMAVLCFDWKLVKECLCYSLPLIPYEMAGYIGHFFSRFIVKNSASLTSLGIFSVAVQITSAIETIQDSSGHAFRPWLNETLKNHRPGMITEIGNVSKLMMCAYSIMYTLVGIYAMEVISVMASPVFFYAWNVVVGMVAVYSIYSLVYFYMYQALYFKDVSNKLFIVFMFCNGIMIFATYVFVPLIGVWGIVIGMFLGANFRWIGIRYLLKKHEQIGYDIRYFIFCIFLSWLFIAIGVSPSWIWDIRGVCWLNISYKSMVFMAFCALLLYFNKELLVSCRIKEKLVEYFKKKVEKFITQ